MARSPAGQPHRPVLGTSGRQVLGTSGRPASIGRISGVTWLLTNMPRSVTEIPITAPVWASLQCHHWNAMPRAMKASMRTWVAADSCLTHVTIWLKTVRTVRSTRSTLLRTDPQHGSWPGPLPSLGGNNTTGGSRRRGIWDSWSPLGPVLTIMNTTQWCVGTTPFKQEQWGHHDLVGGPLPGALCRGLPHFIRVRAGRVMSGLRGPRARRR